MVVQCNERWLYCRPVVKVADAPQLECGTSGGVTDKDHGKWYREMFGPSVTAGILKDLGSGGLSQQSCIRPAFNACAAERRDTVRDVMELLAYYVTQLLAFSASRISDLLHYCLRNGKTDLRLFSGACARQPQLGSLRVVGEFKCQRLGRGVERDLLHCLPI